MTTTSSFKSWSVLEGVVLMLLSLRCRFRGEFLEDLSQDAVERRKRVDHVGQQFQGRRQLDGQDELAKNLARSRRDQGGANQHAALAIADQFDRASMEIVDVA